MVKNNWNFFKSYWIFAVRKVEQFEMTTIRYLYYLKSNPQKTTIKTYSTLFKSKKIHVLLSISSMKICMFFLGHSRFSQADQMKLAMSMAKSWAKLCHQLVCSSVLFHWHAIYIQPHPFLVFQFQFFFYTLNVYLAEYIHIYYTIL